MSGSQESWEAEDSAAAIAVEVFRGNTADPARVAAQVAKLEQRFNTKRLGGRPRHADLGAYRRDGTMHLVMSPLEFLAALVPPTPAAFRGTRFT